MNSYTSGFQTVRKKTWFRPVAAIVFGYFIVHLMLCLLYDARNPQAFLDGDRSDIRMVNIQNILQAETWTDFQHTLLSQGLLGDYIWQAMISRLFQKMPDPRLMVIIVQVLLCAISIFYVALIADTVAKNGRVVTWTTLFYALLPHNFAYPHWLVSEAFFVPFVIMASYYSIAYFLVDARRRSIFLMAFLWGICGLTRPNALLFPLMIFILFLVRLPRKWASHILFLCLHTLIILLWIAPSYYYTGNPNISAQHPNWHNWMLYSKADYLITALPRESQQHEYEWLKQQSKTDFGLSQFLGLMSRHPGQAAFITMIEAAKIILKFDETNFLVYFSGWRADHYWGKTFITDFPSLFRKEPFVILFVLAGTLLWLLPLTLAFLGFIRWVRAKNFTAQFLLILTIYFITTPLIADYAQARFRYAVDFAICLFAVLEA